MVLRLLGGQPGFGPTNVKLDCVFHCDCSIVCSIVIVSCMFRHSTPAFGQRALTKIMSRRSHAAVDPATPAGSRNMRARTQGGAQPSVATSCRSPSGEKYSFHTRDDRSGRGFEAVRSTVV